MQYPAQGPVCSGLGRVLCVVATWVSSAALGGAPADLADPARELPLRTSRTLSFDTQQGTQISFDLSPDGKTLVFDLVGDLYVLPIEGGQATRLTGGAAWDTQPVFSPDGRGLAFISDRNGTKNLWLMNIDGTGARMLSTETGMQIGSPQWLPDARTILVRRETPFSEAHFESSIVAMSTAGGSVQTLYAPSDQFVSAASVSRDSATLYLSHGPRFENPQLYAVERATGKALSLGADPGFAPTVSPDGRWLVYAGVRDKQWGLRLRDLISGREEWLVAVVPWDGKWAAWVNFMPRCVFTPDSGSVLFYADGHIKRVSLADKRISTIPFSAKVEVPAATRVDFQRRVAEGPMTVQQLRWVNLSQDGRRVAFSALDQVWIQDGQREPRRLTKEPGRAVAPAISPDGRWVAYVAGTDEFGMQVFKVPAQGGKPIPLTPPAGYFLSLAWSPDAKKLVYVGSSQRCEAVYSYPFACPRAQLGWMSADGRTRGIIRSSVPSATVPTLLGSHPASRIYYLDKEGHDAIYVSVRLDGTDLRTHARIITSSPVDYEIYPETAAIPSPDGRWFQFVYRQDTYLAPVAANGDTTIIDLAKSQGAAHRLSTQGATPVGWMQAGKVVAWVTTNKLKSIALEEALKDPGQRGRATVVDLKVQVQRQVSAGNLMLRNARVITMRDDEVLESADILVAGHRIAAVGPSGSIAVPGDAKVMDLHGKSIVPGFIDGHDHLATDFVVPQASPDFSSALAYGVTTARDPSGSPETLRWAEFIEAGALRGPRLFGVGYAMHPRSVAVNSYEDALGAVRQVVHLGATSIKQYKQPQRIQRQWMRMAAEEVGFNITNEGGYSLEDDLTMALDGMTGMEHFIRTMPIYNDVIQIMARTGITYTPLLVPMTRYWAQSADYHGVEKLHRFIAHDRVAGLGGHGNTIIFDKNSVTSVAEGMREIVRAGGQVGAGTHGDFWGSIAFHWDMWLMSWGGMKPLDILRSATLVGAEGLGLDEDIGSIETGKLADVVVLDKNPLEDIRNTDSIRYVIKNGIVYNGDTLDELWPRRTTFTVFPWVKEEADYARLRREQQSEP